MAAIVRPVDVAITFIKASEQERSKVYVPDAIVDLFEPDILLDEDVRQTEPALTEADAAVATDVVDAEVARILDGGESRRIGPG